MTLGEAPLALQASTDGLMSSEGSLDSSDNDWDSGGQLSERSGPRVVSTPAPSVPCLGFSALRPASSPAPSMALPGSSSSSLQGEGPVTLDLLSTGVALSAGPQRHSSQDLHRARSELARTLGVAAHSLSFYEVRKLDEHGRASPTGQRLAVHAEGSGDAGCGCCGVCASAVLTSCCVQPSACLPWRGWCERCTA